MVVDTVLLVGPRGFCAGVEMSIKALAWMVREFDPPVYCFHEIVHNRLVVDTFRRHGVVFVEDIEDVPAGHPILLSAHGSAPEVVSRAREKSEIVVDTVCPLVSKVHQEVKTRVAKGYDVVYLGHAGHDEAIGTVAIAPNDVMLVETADDVASLPLGSRPIAFLAQTTLAEREWSEVNDAIVAKAGDDVWKPSRSDLCYATTNRQNAVAEVAASVDAVLVVGSANSSNTGALVRVATEAGARRVLRVNDAAELPGDLHGVVAITAGASAPETIVESIVAVLAPTSGVEFHEMLTEDEYFPPPPDLRRIATLRIEKRVSGQLLSPSEERSRTAADVLRELDNMADQPAS